MCARAVARTLTIYTYGVGYGVAVCNERQYQSLCKWNGNSAVPLFCCIYVLLKLWFGIGAGNCFFRIFLYLFHIYAAAFCTYGLETITRWVGKRYGND